METCGLSLEKRFPSGTFLGASLEVLKGNVSRTIGIIDIVPPLPPALRSPGQAGSTREDLDYEEHNLTITIDQLVAAEWSVGARYKFSDADLRQKFLEWNTVNASPEEPLRLRYHHQSILNRFTLFTVYNHPSGLFGRIESLWSWQRNSGYSPSRPGEHRGQRSAQLARKSVPSQPRWSAHYD